MRSLKLVKGGRIAVEWCLGDAAMMVLSRQAEGSLS